MSFALVIWDEVTNEKRWSIINKKDIQGEFDVEQIVQARWSIDNNFYTATVRTLSCSHENFYLQIKWIGSLSDCEERSKFITTEGRFTDMPFVMGRAHVRKPVRKAVLDTSTDPTTSFPPLPKSSSGDVMAKLDLILSEVEKITSRIDDIEGKLNEV